MSIGHVIEAKVCQSDKTDDLTGDNIERMDIITKLFSNVLLSREGLLELENMIKHQKYDSDGKLNIEESDLPCRFCQRQSSIKMSHNYRSLEDFNTDICQECGIKMVQEGRNKIENLEDSIVHLDEPSGLIVYKRDDEVEIYDIITGKKEKSETVAMFLFGKTRIFPQLLPSNLEKFCDKLKNKDEDVFYSSETFGSCSMCTSVAQRRIHTGENMDTPICSECADNIVESVEEFVENNRKFVVSHSL